MQMYLYAVEQDGTDKKAKKKKKTQKEKKKKKTDPISLPTNLNTQSVWGLNSFPEPWPMKCVVTLGDILVTAKKVYTWDKVGQEHQLEWLKKKKIGKRTAHFAVDPA